jgi:hypothetical protein
MVIITKMKIGKSGSKRKIKSFCKRKRKTKMLWIRKFKNSWQLNRKFLHQELCMIKVIILRLIFTFHL